MCIRNFPYVVVRALIACAVALWIFFLLRFVMLEVVLVNFF